MTTEPTNGAAAALPAPAPPPQIDPLGAALKAKLVELLDKPLTPRMLLEVEQTAKLARQLLAVAKDPRAMRQNGYGSIIGQNITTDQIDFGTIDEGGAGEYVGPMQMGGYNKAETLGVTLIRELVATLRPSLERHLSPPKREPPTFDLILAISYARERGMADLAAKLEAQLLEAHQGEAAVNAGGVAAGAIVGALLGEQAAQHQLADAVDAANAMGANLGIGSVPPAIAALVEVTP